MLFNQRVLWSDNGTIKDLSVNLSDFQANTETIDFVSAEDFIYVGSYLPYNHKYFDVSSANAVTAGIEIAVWDGDTFNNVIEVLDLTSFGGATMATSGIVRFTHDRDETWKREQDSFDVTGLESTEIYNLHWSRINFTADFTASFALNFVGQKFSDDSDLYLYYPDLDQANLKTAFASGKTDWNDQAFAAAKLIQRDLERKASLMSPDQIIDYEFFNEPSVHKVAELIFYGLGRSYADLRAEAKASYADAMTQTYLRLDLNADGDLSGAERRYRQGFMTR